MPSSDQINNVALITGVSEGGIGHGFALGLLERGWTVFGTVRERGREGAAFTERGGKVLIMDVTSLDSIRSAHDEFSKQADHLDLLINNAGMGTEHLIMDVSFDDIQRAYATNVFGPVLVSQVFGEGMVRRGRGKIVVVGSTAGRTNLPFQALYGSSKAAINHLTRTLRLELGPLGIKVILLEPGLVYTPLTGKKIPLDPNGRTIKYYEPKGFQTAHEAFAKVANTGSKDAMPVSKFVKHELDALLQPDPSPVLIYGGGAGFIKYVFPLLPTFLVKMMISSMFKLGGLKRNRNPII